MKTTLIEPYTTDFFLAIDNNLKFYFFLKNDLLGPKQLGRLQAHP